VALKPPIFDSEATYHKCCCFAHRNQLPYAFVVIALVRYFHFAS
jgi:hypothetical protein